MKRHPTIIQTPAPVSRLGQPARATHQRSAIRSTLHGQIQENVTPCGMTAFDPELTFQTDFCNAQTIDCGGAGTRHRSFEFCTHDEPITFGFDP
jgi:hypothetical protein